MNKNAAGLALKGGRKENSYLCVLREHSSRWFLKALVAIKNETDLAPDAAVIHSLSTQNIKSLALDFPLSPPLCETCERVCPGEQLCPVPEVIKARTVIRSLLEMDQELFKDKSKAYEEHRLRLEESLPHHDVLLKETSEPLLSRSFKRRLKKGILPYWNRPLDVWVWSMYYDQLLKVFNISYDSFGHTPLMVLSRMNYLKRHLLPDIQLFESNIYIIFIELLKAQCVLQKDMAKLSDYILGPEARLDILKAIENSLQIFVYGEESEILINSPHAFDSFILAIAARQNLIGKFRPSPQWCLPETSKFLVPIF